MIGVVGGTAAGAQIALLAASTGHRALLVEPDPVRLRRAVAYARQAGEGMVRRGRWTTLDLDRHLQSIAAGHRMEALALCETVIEAAPQRLVQKRAALAAVTQTVTLDAIVASHSCGLPVAALAVGLPEPQRIVGMHFPAPALTTGIVEVVRGEGTSQGTVARARALAVALGKHPVQVGDAPGFVVARILLRAVAAAMREARSVGAEPVRADLAVVAGGPVPLGPYALAEVLEAATLAEVRDNLAHVHGARFDDGGVLDALAASGAGVVAGQRRTVPLDAATARRIARAYYRGALDEACRVRDEGVAGEADIDLAMRLGAGWAEGPLELGRVDSSERMP